MSLARPSATFLLTSRCGRGHARTRGFTLVELLVVIAIIGVLVALLLPAVQAAREAARRSQCQNNLKQLGLGLHMHHDTYGKFPVGFTEGVTQYNEAPWSFFILPFIEQQSLYDLAVPSSHFGVAPNANLQKVFSAVIPTMLCPSDVEVELIGSSKRSRGNYVANNGIGPMGSVHASPPPARGANGVFIVNRQLGMRDLIDGTSNTAVMSELLKVPGDGTKFDYRGVLSYPEGPLYHHNHTPNTNVPDNNRASACISIDRAPCTGAYTAHNNKALIYSARSLHPGGAQVLLGDGSARFVSDTININTWQWLGIPDDGNVLGEF